jgi:hypothetical protein
MRQPDLFYDKARSNGACDGGFGEIGTHGKGDREGTKKGVSRTGGIHNAGGAATVECWEPSSRVRRRGNHAAVFTASDYDGTLSIPSHSRFQDSERLVFDVSAVKLREWSVTGAKRGQKLDVIGRVYVDALGCLEMCVLLCRSAGSRSWFPDHE